MAYFSFKSIIIVSVPLRIKCGAAFMFHHHHSFRLFTGNSRINKKKYVHPNTPEDFSDNFPDIDLRWTEVHS